MSTRHLRTALLFLAMLPAANTAWAVQAHGGSEGLVSHQIGHFLFIIGMGYLVYRLRSMRQRGSGWFEFKVFIWLLIVWNVMTFFGHWMNEFVTKEKFMVERSCGLLHQSRRYSKETGRAFRSFVIISFEPRNYSESGKAKSSERRITA